MTEFPPTGPWFIARDYVCQNVDLYINSHSIVYKNIQLENDESDIPEINEYRTILLDLLLAEFRRYFPDGDVKNFDVFDPKKMPGADDYVRVYGIIQIKELNMYFTIGDEEEILNEWSSLLRSIVSHPSYCIIKNSRTSVFADIEMARNGMGYKYEKVFAHCSVVANK